MRIPNSSGNGEMDTCADVTYGADVQAAREFPILRSQDPVTAKDPLVEGC